MKILPSFFIFSFLLLLLLLLLLLPPSASQTSYYVPVDNIAVDCGTEANTDTGDRKWVGDVNTKFSPSEPPNTVNKSTVKSIISNTINEALYKTARLSRSPFTYSFPVTPGPKFIRLYFLPENYDEFHRFDAFFTVQAAHFTLLKNFSAALVADSSNKSVIPKEYCVHVVGEAPKLNITFIPSPNSYAFINGIEVVSMPENLYYSPAEQGMTTPIIGNNIALELYHRKNLGGDDIFPSQDSGMYRTWDGSNFHVTTKRAFKIHNYSISIHYTTTTPNFTATDSVYQSAIILGTNRTLNSKQNLSLQLPVDVGFNYLVRLHFCQIHTNELGKQRIFTVFINRRNITVVNIDSVNTPSYEDYNVPMAAGNESFILVDLHPLPSESFDVILNGYEVFKQSNGTNLAVPNPVVALAPEDKPVAKNSNATVIIAAVCSSVGFAILFSIVGFVVIWKQSKKKTKRRKKKKKTREDKLLPERRCRIFTFEEICEATDYFSKEREIGVGGFGAVYKGIFEDEDDLTVAIKRLNPESNQGEQEFVTEIELLSELRHFNLVSLIGYCLENKEMLLVYEFMPNGTFKDHLYDTSNSLLPWRKRLEICVGAARGLDYLHTGFDRPIIHRDVKTTNILLDENWVARVSDFGMSKLGQTNTAVSTAVKGTWGYLDPEYHRRLKVTEKSDVFSFGVILFEVLCGRKPLDPLAGEEKFKLTLWAKKCLEKGNVYEIIDPNLKGKISCDCLKQYLELATTCINDHSKNRPRMKEVEEKLRFILKLQEEADGDCSDADLSYPEEPFSPIRSSRSSLRTESYKNHIATMLSGSDFTASSLMSEEMLSEQSSGSVAYSRKT
ncbi:receptor-like protein kinase FERONIA [Cucumis melo var. makuwa]|uniref:Receptor-like protein kinase FERONIA n=1 Tax=Cucumis melo var. makuwa TaxID=1194695 RepID=A0A5D3BN15_CUCMM|nr:receptor-like protein kinase FERONIA [Cucumis melo var. makuwa]TYK00617.1 receptor-like protein kinase FERONIA [Cucumis melo var. makuwa]